MITPSTKRMRINIAVFLAVAALSPAAHPQHLPPGPADWKGDLPPYWRDLRSHPRPDYSPSSGETGAGLFRIRFDYQTGYAKDVIVLKTTGYRDLDQAAVHALVKWSVKRRTHYEIDVPIRFGSSTSDHASNPFSHLPPSVGRGPSGRP